MPYPNLDLKRLLYNDAKSSETYQIRASGVPDFSRLVRGFSDYWINSFLIKEQKKKKLILADWSAAGWPFYKVSAVRKMLCEMLKDGFEIYMWQAGSLVSMNQANLNLIEQQKVRLRMAADSYKVIEDVAAQYRLAKDTVEILDDYWINY